jgi:hypothetical protein
VKVTYRQAALLNNPRLKSFRSWPVAGFEVMRIYFFLENHAMQIIRILHCNRMSHHS